MALLTAHWETVTPAMRAILEFVGQQPFARKFYLAGGSALALRLGHRRSADLDFFTNADEVGSETRRLIADALAPLQAATLESTEGNPLLRVHDVHTGFFGYHYPLLQEPDGVAGIAIASLPDIGLMKLDALIDRGSRKDFYDVYAIAQQVPLEQLLARSRTKYPMIRTFPIMVLESMLLFENADRDFQPELLVELPWEQVRQFFVQQARALGDLWFGTAD